MPTSNTHPVGAKFPAVPRRPAEIVSDLRQIVNNAKQSAAWDTTPQVQAAINVLSADAQGIEETFIQIDQLRKQLVQAEQSLAEKTIAAKQHRKHAEATITVASKGSALAIKGWGCAVAGRVPSTLTDEAPQNVSAKTTRNPGEAVFKCKGMRAKAYVFQHAYDSAFPDGSPAPVVLTQATYTVTGLPPGQKVYCRVAAIRPVIGQSKWSEPVQLTVR